MKIQPLHSSSLPAYNTDPKARARLAAALGLAASLGLAACNDEPLGGDIAAPDTTAVSSSSATAGMPEYSSSSSKDTLTPITEPLSGDIAWVDTATTVDTLVSEPTAGGIMLPASSSSQISSSSQDTAEPLPEDSSLWITLAWDLWQA